MALSDCEKCWDTPCTCGYDYSEEKELKYFPNSKFKTKEDGTRDYEYLINLITNITRYYPLEVAQKIMEEATNRVNTLKRKI